MKPHAKNYMKDSISKMFDIITRAENRRIRMASIKKLSKLVREDMSKYYLRGFKDKGYTQVTFAANTLADPECQYLDRNIYNIDDLLRLDNPLFRISHPNCRCKFNPYGSSMQTTTTPSSAGGRPGGGGLPIGV